MDYRQRITSDPNVMLGKPVIAGTRLTVEFIIRRLSEGMTQNQLLDAYPGLAVEDIQAALAYSADVLANEEPIAV